MPFQFHNRPAGAERGAILYVAVGALLVLSILALGVTSSVLQELKLVAVLTDSNTSFYIPYSVIKAMKIVFSNDRTPSAITLYDLRDRSIAFADKTAEVKFYDEQDRVNIDLASKDILSRLPGLIGNDDLMDEIFNANIAVKEELLLLNGMTEEIYKGFKDLVTTVAHHGININTAAPERLHLIGIDDDLAGKIQDFRAGEDGQEQTEDDGYFPDTGQIIPLLEPYGLSAGQKDLIKLLVTNMLLTTTSDYIRFDITVKKGQKRLRTFEVVCNLTTGAIVSWAEE